MLYLSSTFISLSLKFCLITILFLVLGVIYSVSLIFNLVNLRTVKIMVRIM